MEGTGGWYFNNDSSGLSMAALKRLLQETDSPESISADPGKQKTRHRRVLLNSGVRTRNRTKDTGIFNPFKITLKASVTARGRLLNLTFVS